MNWDGIRFQRRDAPVDPAMEVRKRSVWQKLRPLRLEIHNLDTLLTKSRQHTTITNMHVDNNPVGNSNGIGSHGYDLGSKLYSGIRLQRFEYDDPANLHC